MSSFIIEKVVDISNVNSNNHWENDLPPDDYQKYTPFENYIDFFHQHYQVINLSKTDLLWITEAFKIGAVTGNFPKSYIEELHESCKNYIGIQGNFFVKTNKNSLKEGCHRIGPYKNVKMILESMCTTTSSHSALDSKLFLLPWKELMPDLEFRVFVFNKRITAISQQHWYKPNEYLGRIPIEKIKEILCDLHQYFCKRIVPVIENQALPCNFVMDIAHTLGGEWYFIEINTWGKEYGAGSALFHWERDLHILYGNTNTIVFKTF